MKFIILGPTALRVGDRNIPLGAAKQRALLAVLLYHAGESVPVDAIVELLWNGRAPADCRTNLYALASRVRAALEQAGCRQALDRVPGVDAYRLKVDRECVDLHRFQQLVEGARREMADGRYTNAAVALDTAIGLWGHEPLAELRGARAEHMRGRIERMLFDAQKLLADCQLRNGQHYAVLARLEPLIHVHSLDEELARLWISALAAAGRGDDARTYSIEFRRRFRKQMRTEPSVEIAARVATQVRPPDDPPRRSRPRQLPNDIDHFTGQTRLLALLDSLGTDERVGSRIVVIDGMPGSGKTSLAVHWAHRQRHRFPDGQLYLDANGYRSSPPVTPEDALGRFLRALDVPVEDVPPGVDQRRDRLNQILAGRRVLIVLDNVRNSEQVRPILPAAETCAVLITSRSRLPGLSIRDGVRSVTVQPLDEQEALALLTRMIGAERAGAEPEALRALARLTDGLPLAIRIVGVRVADRPRARIADLVDDLRQHLLDGESEDDIDGSLRACFAWSYRSFPADAARLFRLLGVHPGPSLSVEAATAMSGDDAADVQQLLNALARAHFLNHDIARRYTFHDLLRLYAVDRALQEDPPDERDAALRRLLDWYLLSANNAAARLDAAWIPVPDLPSPGDVEPLGFATLDDARRWLLAERDNVGALTRSAVTNGFYRHGWQIPGTVYDVFQRFSRQDAVLELNAMALSAAELDGHLEGRIGTLNNIATTYSDLDDHHRAAASADAALRLARSVGFLDGELVCAHNLATSRLGLGDAAAAIEIYEHVLDVCRAMSHPGESYVLHKLADARRQTKEYGLAARYYLAALALRERSGHLAGQGATRTALAALSLETGDLEEALGHADIALDLHSRTGDHASHGGSLALRAGIHLRLGRLDDAIADVRAALKVAEEIEDIQRRADLLVALADVLAAAGAPEEATRRRAEAGRLLEAMSAGDVDALRVRLNGGPAQPGRMAP